MNSRKTKSRVLKIIFLFGLFFLPFLAISQIVSPFNIRHQVNQKGGIVMLSNVALTCNSNNSNCAVYQSQFPPNGNHNQDGGITLGYVDIDNDASTWMSSSDSLNLADCSQVTWAGLYWSARITSNTTNFANRNQVRIKRNNGLYQTLTADQILNIQNIQGNPNFNMRSYYCFKDVTSIVQGANGHGRFTIANIVSQTSDNNLFGAWSIVVVYKNQLQSMRNLTVFDGMAYVSNNNNLDIPISGFVTPQVGPVSFELGVVAFEGDRNIAGDRLQFNGNGTFLDVPDPVRLPTDFFNSTLTYNGALTPYRKPSYNNTLGFDTGIFLPDNSTQSYIGNNATSATVRVATSQDAIIPRVITSAIDIYEPDLRATVYINDLNGAPAQPNDILEYTVIAKNIGSDVSLNTYLVDTLDLRTNYIPNTISFLNGPYVGAKTDAASDDQAEYDATSRTIKARISAGANAIQGGSMNNSPNGADSAVVRFRVKVVDDCILLTCDSTLENKAYLFGSGLISNNTFNNGGASDYYDANGCPSSSSNLISVSAPNCPAVDITYNNPLCIGDTLELSVPNSVYANYSWFGPNGFSSSVANPEIPNVSTNQAGTYSVSISLIDGSCQFNNLEENVVVNQNPTIQLNYLNNVQCFNAANGSIQVQGIGNAPFSYSWTNASTNVNFSINNTVTGLSPGSFIVTVQDVNTCFTKDTFSITQPSLLVASASITSNYNGQNISCFGAANGSATVNFSGGVSPYSIQWSNGATTANISNLGPGTYTATITDFNGCVKTSSVTLTQPPIISLNDTKTMVSCFGGSNGAINLTVSGGLPSYSFSWSNGATNEDLTNLSAGTYNVLVTDINGCSKTRSVIITQPSAPLSLTETHVNVSCFGNSTGSIDLSVSGGTSPYTYLWSNGATTQDLSNLSSGTYSVLVTDSKNCTQSLTVIVTQPNAPLSSSIVITNVSCYNGNNGIINLSVSGGTSPYTFSWSNGFTTEDISNLNNGNYSVSIIDSKGCTATNSALVSQPLAPLSNQFSVDNPNCFGGSDGSISLSVSGGTAPYQFSWSNGQTIEDISNLPQGDYSVTITDSKLCQLTADTSLFQPSQLQTSFIKIDVKCFGQASGSIDLTVIGGTQPYSYQWSSGATAEDLTNLLSGSYQVTITDALGCVISNTINILQPAAPISMSETHTNAICLGGIQGTIDLTVSGGTSPYLYNWNNAQTTEDIQNLAAGFYYCVVSDFNSCLDTIGVTILDPSNNMVLSENHTDVSCFSGADGQIDLVVSGGAPAYSYLWNTGSNAQDISGLISGNYFVTVTDFNSCQSFLSVFIQQPISPLNITNQVTNVLCYGSETGSIDVSVTGGTLPYQYLWSNASTDEDIFNLGSANYTLQVTDSKGCLENALIFVPQSTEIEISETHIDVSCFGGNNGNIDVTINGGVQPYNYSWSNLSNSEDLNSLISGNYTLVVTDNYNCSKTTSITISQPASALTLASSITNVSCFAGNDGIIDLTPSGGNGSYQYLWSNGSTSQDLQNLPLGSYSVVVTDLKNCSASGAYLISQPATPLSINVSSLPVNCFGEANGSASVSISGGTPNYSISWSNGATTNSVVDLSAGLYSVIVLDANLCSSTANIQVNQPNLLVVNADSTNVNCFGAATGSLNAIVSGGIAPYTYSWNNGANTVAVSNLISGIYGITITDFNGCIASDSTSINQPQAPLQISFLITNNICFGESQGAIDATVSGGTPPYNYLWSTSEISDFISSLPVGNYQLSITDALGCQLSQDTSVTQPNQIIVTSQYTMVSCFNGVDGAIDVSTSGGVFPYQYSWSNAANSEDITNLEAGNYTLTIEDSNLCQSNFTFTVTQPDTLVISYNPIQPSCFGYSNGQLIANSTGGTSPYSYDWSNGDVTFTADSLSVGTYTVLVTDINGCQAQIDCILNEPPQLQVSFDADSLVGCSPFTVNFQNTSDPSVSCLWNFGDGQSYNGCENVTNTFMDGGTYDVYLAIIDANGCTNNVTYNDFITVNQTPDAEFNVDPQQLFSFSNTANITNQSTGGDFYIWNLGDESSSHLYFEPGEHAYPINVSDTFLITLIAQTIEGCYDTTTKIILFNNDPFYYVPNTFIPDDDGRNDVWKPIFSSIENVRRYSLQVFNRWGEIVFETNDPQTGWNGMIQSNSKKAQDGTYSWKLQFSWFDYKIYPASGHVNLIR